MAKGPQLVDHKTHLEIPIQGRTLTSFVISFAFFEIKILEDDFDLTFRFEGDFFFESAGEQNTLNVRQPTSLSPILSVLNHPLKLIRFTEQGLLEIQFEEDAKLTVKPDPMFESWQLRGDNSLLVVCMPGGRLSIWEFE